MKSDLDRLMQERGLAALIVPVSDHYSYALDYLVGGVHITSGIAVKTVGAAPVIVANPMETDEAAASGLQVYSTTDLGYIDFLKAAEGDGTRATVPFWGHVLKQLGVMEGKVGIYGVGDLHFIVELVKLLSVAHPQYQFSGEMGTTLFDQASLTKGADEMARIQDVARRTGEVLQATWDYIAGHAADAEGTVIQADHTPLTIGDVKRFIRRELLDRGLECNTMIFAQGRDGGVPHSRGQESMALKVGEAIVFDLFPQELGGGYFHDTTRTWSIGHAREDVQQAYNTVMEAFDIALETFAVNKPTHLMQEAVLDHFESKGHPTSRSKEGTTDGYVHSLGHGVGLKIHERPSISHLRKEDMFQVGNVITIEPGLYYPNQGYGVRVEDTFYVSQSGELISLTDFRKDLVLPLRG
ncbi:MAG: M24 family metallopeptidase [bacterium]|nr:M24 family metallopeptidase [bacterium]